jgi:low affinity Fe/Cu permease
MENRVMSSNVRRAWERLAYRVTQWTGKPWAFGIAVAIVVVWLASGPVFHYSDSWQLVINTGTTIVTFLMVFLIQHAQNKDTRAMELKLNELVAAIDAASNGLIDIEELTEEELDTLHEHYRHLASMSRRDLALVASHSIEQAHARHETKRHRVLKR